MKEDPEKCCVCGGNQWESLGTRSYAKDDLESLPPFVAKRYRVLFEIWHPGQDSVLMTSCLCLGCGFVTNDPRPTAEDVNAKYRFLETLGQDYGTSETREIEARRSRILFKQCQKFLHKSSRILDYGGGDGRLMREFADAGHQCFLIDYNTTPRDFVTKLGDTLDGETAGLFDLIVCNHVIEHVPDPVRVVTGLGGLLEPNGALFVEVPQEIWRKPPLHIEPVTHVNFFVADSLRRVMEESELRVSEAYHGSYLHTSGTVLPSVCVIGHPGGTRRGVACGVRTVQRLINPKLIDRTLRAWILRKRIFQSIAYKLGFKKGRTK